MDIVRFIRSCGIKDSQISVFTPYTAQKVKITKALQQALGQCNVETLSVYASQGREGEGELYAFPVYKIQGELRKR